MKNKIKLNPRRGLLVAAVALSLASDNGYALTTANPANLAGSSARTVPSAASMSAPSGPGAATAMTPGVTTEDIHDIRGPRHIPSPWPWPWLVAGGLAFGAVFCAAWIWNRRRVLASQMQPYEIALALLERARALIRPESAREFSIAVSEIVRHYIEERFHVRAAHRTTEEFLHDLVEPSDALLASHRALLADFLLYCDLAKFARWVLPVEEMETMHTSARSFVLQTGAAPAPETICAAAPPAPDRILAKSEPVLANH